MLNLLIKDFKLFFSSNKSVKERLISSLLTIIFLGAFIAFEAYLFVAILKKVGRYPNASVSFLILFLFVISIIMIFIDLFRANKLFFNELDNELSHFPIPNENIILAKLVFLFIIHYATSILFVYPIFLAYGVINNMTPFYYFTALFYPCLSFLFECGVALLLVYPFKLALDYLKKHIIIQFLVSMLIMIAGCLMYSYVLEAFMDLVTNNNLNALFTTESLNTLGNVCKYLLPISLLVKSIIGSTMNLISYICLSLGIFIIGLMVAIFTYNRLRTLKLNDRERPIRRILFVKGVDNILIKKELELLFKDSNNIFSFSGLLLVEPFLMYLVVSSLNNVFTSGPFQYYMMAIPAFIPIMDMVLIMLFTLIINSGANSYIENERNTIRIMKTIPVKYSKQLLIKALVPYTLSSVALLVSDIVLVSTGEIGANAFIFSFILTLALLFIFELASLHEELNIRIDRKRASLISSLYAYLIPLIFFVVAIILSNLKINMIIVYLVGLMLIILLGLPFIINLKKRCSNSFMDLEVIN